MRPPLVTSEDNGYVHAMRRLIAILVLLGGGWSQLSALDCPMENPAEQAHASAAPVDVDGMHRHQADGADASDEGSRPPGSHHSDSDCRLLMTCAGGILTAGRAILATSPGPISVSAVSPVDGSHDAVFLNHEPPPPRLPV